MQPETLWIDSNGRRTNWEVIRKLPTIDGTRHPDGLTPEQANELGFREITIYEKPDDYSDEFYYRTEQDDPQYVIYTKKSDEQIAQIMFAKAKQARLAEVDAIVVDVGFKQFDGNEDAQNRMARAAVAMSDTDAINWVLADNTVASVTKAELLAALRLAGAAMAAIWVRPYA